MPLRMKLTPQSIRGPWQQLSAQSASRARRSEHMAQCRQNAEPNALRPDSVHVIHTLHVQQRADVAHPGATYRHLVRAGSLEPWPEPRAHRGEHVARADEAARAGAHDLVRHKHLRRASRI